MGLRDSSGPCQIVARCVEFVTRLNRPRGTAPAKTSRAPFAAKTTTFPRRIPGKRAGMGRSSQPRRSFAKGNNRAFSKWGTAGKGFLKFGPN
jgi:hypothetical protein